MIEQKTMPKELEIYVEIARLVKELTGDEIVLHATNNQVAHKMIAKALRKRLEERND